jgi:hypothetical protein
MTHTHRRTIMNKPENPQATSNPDREAGGCCGPSPCSRICPECGSPETSEGQPSKRIFFGCGSYTYVGEMEKLTDQTELCQLRAGMQEAWKLVNAMAGQDYWQRAEDWLAENREYAPREIISANPSDHRHPPK